MYPGPEILQRQPCRPGPSLAKHPNVQALAFRARARQGADTGATDLLGARCLSGYTAPREGDGCGEASSRKDDGKKKMLNAPREIRGERSLHAAPQSIARPAHSSNDRPTDRPLAAWAPGRAARVHSRSHTRTHIHTPPPAFHPTRGSPPRRLAPLLLPSPTSTAWRVARHVRFCAPRAGGVGTPGRHLPSSLSSTIISGAPCPAAAGLGREKGAPTPGALRFVGATTDRPTDRPVLARAAQRAGL